MGPLTPLRLLLPFVASVTCCQFAVAGVSLKEAPSDDRVYSVRCRLQVDGTLSTAARQGQSIALKMKVDGRLSYLERRLAAAGRDSHTLRSVRSYELAEANIDVGERRTSNRLPETRRLIVAEGRAGGVRHWSKSGPMTSDSINLLRAPGDSLALIALLPESEVDAASEWDPPHWVMPMLTGVEAVSESKLHCRIESLDERYAVIVVDGQIEGATLGALTKISLNGKVAYDRKSGHIRQAQITQTEDRTVGTVSPGMQVKATMYVDRQVSGATGPLTDALADSLPINPEAEQLAVAFVSQSDMYVLLDRDWHVFHQTNDVAVLRLVEGGSLVAQCNVSRLPRVAAGSHTPGPQFVADIQMALGNQVQEISDAQPIRVDDGRQLLRVTARGTTRDVPMEWYYYLCAAPDGRQVACVFSIESRLAEAFIGRDEELVRSVRFLTPAERTAGKPLPQPQ